MEIELKTTTSIRLVDGEYLTHSWYEEGGKQKFRIVPTDASQIRPPRETCLYQPNTESVLDAMIKKVMDKGAKI